MEQKSQSEGGASAPSTVRFGAFELDLRAAELRKNGHKIRLQQQPFQILVELLERPGEVVLREEIRGKLWPNDTVVEFDHSINAAVKRLRDSLQDSAESPRYIETLARRGYRFIAPVSCEPEKALPPEAPPLFVRESRWTWSFVALLALAAALVAGWLAYRLNTSGAADLRVTPLTTYPGHQLQPSFSPDGTRVAFSWDGPDGRNADIYVKLIGPGDPVRLTTDPARDFSPAWSPDGLWIAALRDLGREVAVLLIPASGGPQREVTRIDVEERGSGTCMWGVQAGACAVYFYGSTLAWSPDGKFLFTSARSADDSPLAIIRINVETGERQPITVPPRGIAGDLAPAVSPDGARVLFLRTSGFATRDIWVIPLTNGALSNIQPKRLTHDGLAAGPPVWTPDGRELIFSSDRGGRQELWRMSASRPGYPARLAGTGENAYSISLRGQRLVYEQKNSSASLWKIPIESGKSGEPIRVTATTRVDLFPHPSPDGKRIVFQSDRSGVNEIWLSDADGANAVQLTSFGKGWSGSPRWSPDGRTIAFDSNVEGNFDIWIIRAEGGQPVRLTRNAAEDVIPSWSHDGHWIYFASRRTGRYQIWKIHLDGSAETQLTTGGGWAAYESADASYLYYKDIGEAPIWRIPLAGGTPIKITDFARGRVFTPTEHGIYFPAGPEAAELRFLDFPSGAVRIVATLGTPGSANAAVAPDGRWALYSRSEHASTNLILVENFR